MKADAPAPVPAAARVAFFGSSGCGVSLDGRPVGSLVGTLLVIDHVAPGSHTVTCRGGPLDLDFVKELSVLEGESRSLTLDPQRATLQSKVSPRGKVFIDGQSVGLTPLSPQTVFEGRHFIEVEGPSGTKVEREIVLAAGDSQTVRLMFDSP